MRAGVCFVIANPPTPRIGERQATLKTGWSNAYRPLQMAMVLVFLSSMLAMDLPWLCRRARRSGLAWLPL